MMITPIDSEACFQELLEFYEQARSDGLCVAGAWEVARTQIQASDCAAILQQKQLLERLFGGTMHLLLLDAEEYDDA